VIAFKWIGSGIATIARNWLNILKWTAKIIGWTIASPFIALFYGFKFAGYVIKYVHSDRRLLCLCDSALGTAVGLYWHTPFIGLVAGAVSGLVSYQLISVKLLKLQLKH
jgi:phosphate/sulfate permease